MRAAELWLQVPQDLYRVLAVSPHATPDDIHQAWRAAAKRSHPDTGGSEQSFRAVHIAYLVLSDPGRRARYDRHRALAAAATRAVADWPPVQPDPLPARRLWLMLLLGVLALVASYLWPAMTIVTGVVVGGVVLHGYHHMYRRRRGLD